MDTRNLPTREVVIRDGQPIWRVCGGGLCVEEHSGVRAMEALRAMALSHGIELPASSGPSLPMRGPSEVDEPEV